MLPAWLMPGALPETSACRLVGSPRLSKRNKVHPRSGASGCTSLVTWHLQSVARIRGPDGELTLAQLTQRTGCKASTIGSVLSKLQDKGWVKPTSHNRGRAYRWTRVD